MGRGERNEGQGKMSRDNGEQGRMRRDKLSGVMGMIKVGGGMEERDDRGRM